MISLPINILSICCTRRSRIHPALDQCAISPLNSYGVFKCRIPLPLFSYGSWVNDGDPQIFVSAEDIVPCCVFMMYPSPNFSRPMYPLPQVFPRAQSQGRWLIRTPSPASCTFSSSWSYIGHKGNFIAREQKTCKWVCAGIHRTHS